VRAVEAGEAVSGIHGEAVMDEAVARMICLMVGMVLGSLVSFGTVLVLRVMFGKEI